MYFDLNNERMIASSRTYNKASREIEERFDVPRPQREYGQSLCDSLIAHVGQIRREAAESAAREGYWRGLRAAARNLPDAPEDGLHVPRRKILIKTASVGWIKTRSFNSWSHL